jgi:hypothetical protein
MYPCILEPLTVFAFCAATRYQVPQMTQVGLYRECWKKPLGERCLCGRSAVKHTYPA